MQPTLCRCLLPSWPLVLVCFVATTFPGLSRVTASVQAGPVGCALGWPGAQFHPAGRSLLPPPCPSSEHIWFLTDKLPADTDLLCIPHPPGKLGTHLAFFYLVARSGQRFEVCLQEPGNVQSKPPLQQNAGNTLASSDPWQSCPW